MTVILLATVVPLWAMTAAPPLWASCVFGWLLLALSVVDWRSFRLPNPLVALLATGGLVNAWSAGHLPDSVVGAAAGLALFVGVGWAYRRARGHAGLGLGDAKLLGALGAWLTWQALPAVVLVSALGALAFVAVRSRRLDRNEQLPFGPFLAGAGWLLWLYG